MFSLYIHIPFCVQKCKYCDFPSYVGALCYADRYIDALLTEAEKYRGGRISTIFIGGGTPSLLSSAQIDRLVNGIASVFDVSGCEEFSIEANPESITAEKLRTYRDVGINRISIGLQSPNDEDLVMLGRAHDFATFSKAYELASGYFDNINIDIISGLPGHNLEKHTENLKKVLHFAPKHLSVYSLIPEEGTAFFDQIASGDLMLPDEAVDRDIYHATHALLSANGYERYEISNYAKDGYACKHNIRYWMGGDYLGIGCAAHSLIDGVRYSHSDSIEQYLIQPLKRDEEKLCQTDRYEEFIMLRLRMKDGIDLNEFKCLFNYDLLSTKHQNIDFLINNGLINVGSDRITLTEKGFDLCDSVILKLI